MNDPRYSNLRDSGPPSPPGYASSSSSPPSSFTSPRSSRHGSIPESTILTFGEEAAARPSSSIDQDDRDCFGSSNSDSYDSTGESGNGGAPMARYASARYSTEDGGYFSSRASSPVPPELWEGYQPDVLSYRSVSRNRSRQVSGTTTPMTGGDSNHGTDYLRSQHYQTSALLRKLGGSLVVENSPVLGYKKRRPGWWARRAETRRKHSHSSQPNLSTKARPRSCLSTFGAALLRQPWVPTQPLTVLFAFLLFGCFAASLTTSLVHILDHDKQPLPWRTFCAEQNPFPHALADSLAPVNVFVGVFSVDAAYERRQLIRSTYARHTKSIDPRTGRPAQNIQLKFILGRPRLNYARRIALEMEMYNDVVVLDVVENMNKGKTHRFFQWAAENATIPVYYQKPVLDPAREGAVGVGFRKADYVVKADDDSFLVLSELERHLRISPREKTYWGYMVRSLFMAGEIYALSADLVQYVATYQPLLPYTTGAEDKRVAKWMRMHPNASEINWVGERCWIYDHPKAGTVYSHGFLFPDEVERVRVESRRGLGEAELAKRGGEMGATSYSSVRTWKQKYAVPVAGMSMEEEVEALIEGGGKWANEGLKVNAGRGAVAVQASSILFEHDDVRLYDPRIEAAALKTTVDRTATGVKPGIPDRSAAIASEVRTTRFGKDLFRNPDDVEAVRLVKRTESFTEEEVQIIHNLLKPASPTSLEEEGDDEATWTSSNPAFSSSRGYPPPSSLGQSPSDSPLPSSSEPSSSVTDESSSASSSSSTESSSSSEAPSLSSTPTESSPTPSTSDDLPLNTPTGQIRLPAHNYILPPPAAGTYLPPPTLRYDPSNLSLRQRRMLNLPHGGTVAVHFLKRNEWFIEAALAFIGREKLWDAGNEALAYSPVSTVYEERVEGGKGEGLENLREANLLTIPTWDGVGRVESVVPYWGGARMYGSPIVRENGYISEGRPADAKRTAGPVVGSKLGRLRNGPKFGMRLEDGVEVVVGGSVGGQEQTPAADVPIQFQES